MVQRFIPKVKPNNDKTKDSKLIKKGEEEQDNVMYKYSVDPEELKEADHR